MMMICMSGGSEFFFLAYWGWIILALYCGGFFFVAWCGVSSSVFGSCCELKMLYFTPVLVTPEIVIDPTCSELVSSILVIYIYTRGHRKVGSAS